METLFLNLPWMNIKLTLTKHLMVKLYLTLVTFNVTVLILSRKVLNLKLTMVLIFAQNIGIKLGLFSLLPML